MEVSLTEQWADFLTKATFSDLPPEVVQQTKMYILDSIGCALGGYAIDLGKKIAELGKDLGGKPEATVIGSGDKLHCANTAYVNGKVSNLLDMDETLYNNRHIGGCALFPALSMGERVKATGEDIILATALAYDFGARSGICGSSFHPDPDKGVVVSGNGTMSFNTFASVIAAAKVSKFDKAQMSNVMGIVGYFAPGAIESKFVFTPPSNINKYADMGWFCSSGIMAVLCAQNGYVGDPSVLDGPRGLAAILGAPEFDYDTFMAEMGKRWYILDAGFKPYPYCRWFHNGLKLLEDIMEEHDLKPEDIDSITVNTHPLALTLPAFTAADKWSECTDKVVWVAVNSISFAFACTVYGVTPGPDWAKEETFNDPRIIEMSKKIIHGEHPDAMRQTGAWTGHPGKIFSQPPTSIEVKSKKGNFTAESNDVPGDSWNPRSKLTDDQIITKFKNCARDVLNDSKINQIVEAVSRLDKIKDIRELTGLLAP